MHACLATFAVLLVSAPLAGQTSAAAFLNHAKQVYRSGDRQGARRAIAKAIDVAIQEKDVGVEAEARFTLATLLSEIAQYDASESQLAAASTLFEQLGDRRRIADVHSVRGLTAYGMGRTAQARGEYEKALGLYEDLQDSEAVAREHRNLSFVTEGAESLEHVQRGLELARKLGYRKTEADLLHSWGDIDFGSGAFDSAFERLNQARSILEDLGARRDLADVLDSLGRVYRAHGHPEQALLMYQRARDLHREAGDVKGQIQSLNSMGIALHYLGRASESLRYDQEALQLARESGSPLLIKAMLEAVGSTQLYLHRNAQAAATLEEARKMAPPRAATQMLLSEARFRLGQYDAAWKAADEAVAMGGDTSEVARSALENRAQALWKLGRTEEALRDIRQLTELVERERARLVPTDFMKQGFSDTDREATTLSVRVLLDAGQEREALQVAERARGRAFLDLLATKGITPNLQARAGDTIRPNPAPPVLASSDDVLAVARRLNSTILSYWVDDSQTIIWVVSPDGRISHAQANIGAPAIDQWMDEALHASHERSPRAPVQIVSRGGEVLVAGAPDRTAWRHLYDALIRPVRASLPSQPGSRLTIIPSGPLFRVSFAGLMDEKGRYLIESYSLNYSPAIEVFQFTGQAHQRNARLPARYLLVANPLGMPSVNGKTLALLPGSEQEVLGISRQLPADSTVVLKGRWAEEDRVRIAMPAATVIHFATHGVIDSSNPLGSFLALGTSGSAGGNGRLTAEEVYSLNLHADLVVLSACRTGLGRISGDGVAGLARAFFYAGASSVVSTLWDVADQPTSRLMEDFYRSFSQAANAGKSEALRQAQLHLLHALRKGEVRVDTPFGLLPLPEDPVVWADYILLGEPQ